jgi:hypothetical protein
MEVVTPIHYLHWFHRSIFVDSLIINSIYIARIH